MNKGIKVRLKVDLTEYLPGLVIGTEGITIGTNGMWSCVSDRFVGVYFPGKGSLDVLWRSLEIIDKEYLKEVKENEARFLKDLKSASNVVKVVGPRGGFRYISYTFTNSEGIESHVTNAFRKEANKLIEFFNRNGIEITTKIIE